MAETYPEMNAKIVDLLRWDKDNLMLPYAAQRIEELEMETEQAQRRYDSLRIHFDAAQRVLTRLQCELHDERIRRDEWEKMFNQAVASPASDALPCGHPRSAMRSDGAAHWCAECEKEAKG